MITRFLPALLLLAAAPALYAQAPSGTALDDVLATRAALERLADSLAALPADSGRERLEQVRRRLAEGDFRRGDRILIDVLGEPTLSDTFTVTEGPQLELPPPTVGTLLLRGILRSEADERITAYLGRFLHDPRVRARPLVRLAVEGEVARAGFHDVPADALLSAPIGAAGGATPRAEMTELRIERDGDELWSGTALQQALAGGRTLAEALLRDGDRYVVPSRDDGNIMGTLRFMWVIVSLAGGVYGLTRAF